MKKTSQKESDTVIFHLKKRIKCIQKSFKKLSEKCSKNRPKNVQKSTNKRSKNSARGLPEASLVPPWGLPGASLGPPDAFLDDMQHNVKKQEKRKVSLDVTFQKNVKFRDPRRTPKSPRSGPENEKKVKNDVLFDAPVGVTVLGGFFHRFFIIFPCFFDAFFLVFFNCFEKWKSA